MTISLEEHVARPTPGQAAFYEFWRHKNGVTRWEWESIDPSHKLFWNRIGEAAAESERAACEAIAREMSIKYLHVAKTMKRSATRAYFEKAANALDHYADAIAARNVKGEGK